MAYHWVPVSGAFSREALDGADLLPLVGLSQSALSQHLARLREDGLVSARKSGTAVFYRIADPAALQVIGVLAEIFCPPASA